MEFIAITIDPFEFAKKTLMTVQTTATHSKRYESLFNGKLCASGTSRDDAAVAGNADGDREFPTPDVGCSTLALFKTRRGSGVDAG